MPKKTKIFPGYKQVKKTLLHPIKQLPGGTKPCGYLDDMLPEIIWVALMYEQSGYKRGLGILQKIVQIADTVVDKNNHYSLVSATCYSYFSDEQKSQFVEKLKEKEFLDYMQKCLVPLVLLYDEFPMRFIGVPSVVYNRSELVNIITLCVKKYTNKYNTPGVMLNAAATAGLWATNRIKYNKGITIPNIDAIIDNPKSKEAQKSAGHFRASALGIMFGYNKNRDISWAKYFWDHGYVISSCEIKNTDISQ